MAQSKILASKFERNLPTVASRPEVRHRNKPGYCRPYNRIGRKKISFVLFAFELKYVNFCEILFQRNQSDFFPKLRGPFNAIKIFLQNGRLTTSSRLRENRHVLLSKQELSGFRLVFVCDRFCWNCKEVKIEFSEKKFFSKEKQRQRQA